MQGNIVAQWLIHSYLYYIKMTPIITDSDYDTLSKNLLNDWDSIEHPHKHLIDKSALTAGTGYYLLDADYPLIVKSTALQMRAEYDK